MNALTETITDWSTQPEALTLFSRAYDLMLASDDRWYFPYDMEAELDALCGEHEWLCHWDAYVGMREAAQIARAA